MDDNKRRRVEFHIVEPLKELTTDNLRRTHSTKAEEETPPTIIIVHLRLIIGQLTSGVDFSIHEEDKNVTLFWSSMSLHLRVESETKKKKNREIYLISIGQQLNSIHYAHQVSSLVGHQGTFVYLHIITFNCVGITNNNSAMKPDLSALA